jgi:hAT family C-terminal dimerisation region
MPQFWGSYLQGWPLLGHLALKVISVASSSAASERNFSTMGFIHSELQNCLGRDTVEILVYVKTNNLQFTVDSNLDAYNSASDNKDLAVLDLSQILLLKNNRFYIKTMGFVGLISFFLKTQIASLVFWGFCQPWMKPI